MKHLLKIAGAVVVTIPLVLLNGCQAVMGGVGQVGAAAGVMTPQQAKSLETVGGAMDKASEKITPEKEYWIGRTVGASVVAQYKVYNNAEATHYLNVLGQTLSKASDMPETFGGYHFLIMDTEDVNAFAAPGGLIFISRGMLKCCKNEDALAAVLAHEVGHVEKKHGLGAIGTSRITTMVTVMGTEAAKSLGGQELAQLTEAFEGSIGDITQKMMNSGYGRGAEREADKAAVKIMMQVGYDPNGLVAMLTEMKKYLKPGGHDFAQTHPPPEARIADVKKWIGNYQPALEPVARQSRFNAVIGKL